MHEEFTTQSIQPKDAVTAHLGETRLVFHKCLFINKEFVSKRIKNHLLNEFEWTDSSGNFLAREPLFRVLEW